MDGKTEAMRLPHIVIRVLSDNNDFDFVKRTGIESIENIFPWREDGVMLFLFY